jgi:3-phenylpropionate/trans-cinnamate dioxygenase ferredoxin reductase subunit
MTPRSAPSSDKAVNLVIGGGQAGARAVQGMIEAGFKGRIELIGNEPIPPYERPPLSKEALAAGGDPSPKPILENDFYAQHGVIVALGEAAMDIEPTRRIVTTSAGRKAPYDRLLLATGSRPRRLRIPGSERTDVLYLRTFADSLALRHRLRTGCRVAIVGAGLIGLEVAAAARQLGCEVSVIEAADHVLGRVASRAVGDYVMRRQAAHGVRVLTGVAPSRIAGQRTPTVALTDGRRLEVDVVLVGIGVEPQSALAVRAGLAVDDGVLTDTCCLTSDADIFAAGDVARRFDPMLGRHIRLETWQNAEDEGLAAGRGMAGTPTPCREAPWAWSDQFDLNIQIAGSGVAEPGVDIVRRGDVETGSFTTFALVGGRMVGAITINRGRDMAIARRMIGCDRTFESSALADETLPLRRLFATEAMLD